MKRQIYEEPPKAPKPPPPTEKERLEDWRLGVLTDAWRKQEDVAFTVEDAECLLEVARGECDLHEASAALAAGCDPQTLRRIFT